MNDLIDILLALSIIGGIVFGGAYVLSEFMEMNQKRKLNFERCINDCDSEDQKCFFLCDDAYGRIDR